MFFNLFLTFSLSCVLLRESLINVQRTDVYEPKILYLDLEDLKTLETKAVEALSLFGEIDIVVNNAGMSVRSQLSLLFYIDV